MKKDNSSSAAPKKRFDVKEKSGIKIGVAVADDGKPNVAAVSAKAHATEIPKNITAQTDVAEFVKNDAAESAVKFQPVAIKRKKSVMFAASEGLPFVKTGGLSDVIGSLPKAIAALGEYDVSVIMPLYSKIDRGIRQNFSFIGNFNVGLAWRNQYCGLYSFRLDNVTYYFIDNEYYFKRDGIYGYYDDGERFAFFSKAVIDSMGYTGYYPDVLNCNDWQSAAAIIYLKTLYKNKFGYSQIKTLFTVHNIEYQGKFGMETYADLFGFPAEDKSFTEYDGCVNLMKGAIELADRVSTVSPSYAEEIKNPYYASGLQTIINWNSHKLSGILNGIDTVLYDPATDPALFSNYNADNFSGKALCKSELQKMLGLPVRENVPIIAVISRLVSHKGLDLVQSILEELLCEDVQFVVLGKGDISYENYFKYVESRYNGKFRALIAFNRDMASKIYSGADMLLMPSRQEPCGLSQMIACRYGTIPIVRKTGGLGDSITPYNTLRDGGNGFVFNNFNSHEMLYVIKDAIFTYGNREVWNAIVRRAMTTDFGWKKSADKYEKLFDEIIGDVHE